MKLFIDNTRSTNTPNAESIEILHALHPVMSLPTSGIEVSVDENGELWTNKKGLLAYAKTCSPEFHKAVKKAFKKSEKKAKKEGKVC